MYSDDQTSLDALKIGKSDFKRIEWFSAVHYRTLVDLSSSAERRTGDWRRTMSSLFAVSRSRSIQKRCAACFIADRNICSTWRSLCVYTCVYVCFSLKFSPNRFCLFLSVWTNSATSVSAANSVIEAQQAVVAARAAAEREAERRRLEVKTNVYLTQLLFLEKKWIGFRK